MRPLDISGAWVHEPAIYRDQRGQFLEWFRGQEFDTAIGRRLNLAQANLSVSQRGVLRGIHYAEVPPGQAKYITCVRGAVLDVVVDIRLGSPTFGAWRSVQLDDDSRRAVFLAEGLGHAFLALTDAATVCYICSTPYDAEREHAINPLDDEIGITWPDDIAPILSDKDATAPTLAQAQASALLPTFAPVD
jgi:dTDP-4-dehydrorhamnose 3,5-epimerase